MSVVAKLMVEIGAKLDGLNKSLPKAEASLQKFAKNATAIGGVMSKALTVPLVGFATASVFAFDKQAKAIAQVEQGIISTGGAAKRTSKELQRMASALQENSLFGDEEILTKVTAQLLTFTNISGTAFDRTQQAALDLASRLGGDLQSASIQLGKALNDPVANLSALSRSGIQFSKDQKALIDSLVETGRLAEAQVIILDELEKQYGGSAKAAAEAGSGGITQLKNSFGDLMEQIGEVIIEAINPFVDRLKAIVKQLQSTDKETLKFYATIGLIGAVIGPALLGLGLLAQGLLAVKTALAVTFANPFVLVAAGVIALTGYFVKLYIEANKVKNLLGTRFDANMPVNDQIQQAIDRVEALDKRVTGLRKNLGVGVTTAEGLEAQQRQLKVAEMRLDVERQMLISLIAQSKETKSQADDIANVTEQVNEQVTATQSIADIIDKNKTRIDEILNTYGKISNEQQNELSGLLGINNELNRQLELRRKIAEMASRGQDPDLSRNVQRQGVEVVDLEVPRVDAERYANSMLYLGNTLQKVTVDTQNMKQAIDEGSVATEVLTNIANNFTASFGQGMANVIVQGEKLQDVLRNIGKLLLSSAIQRGISLLLTGGLASAGTGFFGSGGGIFGRLFGGATRVNDAMITSTGRVIEFSPKDNILAMQDFGNLQPSMSGGGNIHVTFGQAKISGTDLYLTIENVKRTFR